jgi:uncharacterized protein (DUF3084 family)
LRLFFSSQTVEEGLPTKIPSQNFRFSRPGPLKTGTIEEGTAKNISTPVLIFRAQMVKGLEEIRNEQGEKYFRRVL